jgi:hypothetical protein
VARNALVFDFGDHRISRSRSSYLDPDEALKAVGLAE